MDNLDDSHNSSTLQHASSEGDTEDPQSAKEIPVPHQLDPDPFGNPENSKSPKRLLSVQASYYYSAALTSNGEVYTWGSGEFGKLGYMDAKR